MRLKTQVLIIGAGATGTGLARDLALRGVSSILVEKRDLNAGASGSNHGYLHSGARYVYKDLETSRECYQESLILQRIAPQCIDNSGGLFVAVQGDDENYAAQFPALCARCDIPVQPIDAKEARELEPLLSDKLIAAYATPEAAINPFRLSCDNMSHAMQLGARLMRWTKVVGFETDNRRISAVKLKNTRTAEETTIEAEVIVSATGAWAGELAALIGGRIRMAFSKGTLLITHQRMTRRVIMRLRPPGDGDALIPSGSVSILGTSSVRVENPDDVNPTVEEVDLILREGAAMIPQLGKTRYIRAFAGVRPLIVLGAQDGSDDRALSRDFVLFDHMDDGIENCLSITGGKLTTYRLMAEKTADLVCERLGVSSACLTRTEPLPSSSACQWTEPALSPRIWLRRHDPSDLLLCECEMVPRSVVDEMIDSFSDKDGNLNLGTIVSHSRAGRGACQGTFCGARLTGYLYDRGKLSSDQGLADLRRFLRERWKGQAPILWDLQLQQAELEESLYCGLFGLELKGC